MGGRFINNGEELSDAQHQLIYLQYNFDTQRIGNIVEEEVERW